MSRAPAGLLLLVAAAAGGQQPAAPARDPGYDALEVLVGRWTTKGSEDTDIEICDWYAGRFHIVCHSESKRPDGSTGKGISILSYVPGSGYVYTGIGDRGRYETQHGGTFNAGVLTFIMPSPSAAGTLLTRTRMGPFDGATVPFVVDTSTDGRNWTVAYSTDYIRLAPVSPD